MKYFYDTEFNEKPGTIDLISIGIVAEDGREYYAVSNEFNIEDTNQWVKENVIPHLPPESEWRSRVEIRDGILAFIGDDDSVELWGYYADYDHVALCWLFGCMIDLPSNMPMFTHDLKQYANRLKGFNFPDDPVGEHNAIVDARWNKELYLRLCQHEEKITEIIETLKEWSEIFGQESGGHEASVKFQEMADFLSEMETKR